MLKEETAQRLIECIEQIQPLLLQQYFTVDEALKYMHNTVSERKFMEAVRNNEIKTYQPGDKKLLFRRDDIDAYVLSKRKTKKPTNLTPEV